MTVTVSAFYKFVTIEDAPALRERLLAQMSARGMKGTILLAREGINGTISAAPAAMVSFLALLRADDRFADLVAKEAPAPNHPFRRLKVKLKREIVTFGRPEADPNASVGTYVPPEDWNALISDPEVLVLDTRNSYEVEAGTFVRAVDPGTRAFVQFPAYVEANLDPQRQRKVAMFCTGGIRCEKASSYMKQRGFEVYHLQGGILNYLARVPVEQSLWQGKCFVFDERVAVDGDDLA